jgi:hypothetical protein
VPVIRRGRTGGFHLGADKFGQSVAQIPGESFHLGACFRLLPILKGGDRLGDVLLHFLQLAERQCLEIEISHWCGPCPECPGIDTPPRQGAATPGGQGQGWQRLVIAVFVAKEVLNWGSSSPGWQGDEFWHGLLAHRCLLGHPFD